MKKRLIYLKQPRGSAPRLACILFLTTWLGLTPEWSQASDIHGQMHNKGSADTAVSCQPQVTYQPANTMQHNTSGFATGHTPPMHPESFSRQTSHRSEVIHRTSGGPQPNLINPIGKPTSLQSECKAKDAEIEAFQRNIGGSKPDTIHPVSQPTNLQKECKAKDAEIEAFNRSIGRSQPDLIHPVGEPTNLQKQAIEKETEAQIKAIPRKSGRRNPDGVDGARAVKPPQMEWTLKIPKKNKPAIKPGQDGNSLAPQTSSSKRSGVMTNGNPETADGKHAKTKHPARGDLRDPDKHGHLRIKLKVECMNKVKPRQHPWLDDDYCGLGRHERFLTTLKQESETNARLSTNRVQSDWCGNERRERFEAVRWKLENNQAFEQPLAWISAARESHAAKHRFCSGGRCPDNTRGTHVEPGIAKETMEKLLYPSGSPHSDETKREIEKAKAQGTLIGAGILAVGAAAVLAAKGMAALMAAGGGAAAANPNSANRAFQFFKNTAGKFRNSLADVFNRTPKVETNAVQKVPGLANTINHIFGKEAHNLGGLVNQFGSRESAFNALYDATNALVKTQGTTGIFETVVNVGSQVVTVRGNVIDQVLRITTAFIP